MPQKKGKYGGILENSGSRVGMMEHDCLDCGASWDVRNHGIDEYCHYCDSMNIVRREGFKFDHKEFFGQDEEHDVVHNHGYTDSYPLAFNHNSINQLDADNLQAWEFG